MNRGSGGARSAGDGTGCSFNEAPIHESGKCSNGSERAASGFSFNEAPIHESGK